MRVPTEKGLAFLCLILLEIVNYSSPIPLAAAYPVKKAIFYECLSRVTPLFGSTLFFSDEAILAAPIDLGPSTEKKEHQARPLH